MNPFSIFWYIGGFVVAVGVLVVVHEFGHYLAARWCGVKVLRFSVGFGKVIYARKRGEDQTEWTLSALPLGGYVKMLDEREGEVAPAEQHRAFNRQPVGRRAVIVAAGPIFNLLFAIFLYWVMFMAGVQDLRPLLAEPEASTAAAAAGVHARDLVTEVDGRAVHTWGDLRLGLIEAGVAGEPLALTLKSAEGEERQIRLDVGRFSVDGLEDDFQARFGFKLYRHPIEPRISKVVSGSPAEAAGIQAGDLVLSIDEEPIVDWRELQKKIAGSPEKELHFAIQRGSERLVLAVAPKGEKVGHEMIGRMGVAAPAIPESFSVVTLVRLGPFDSLGHSITQTWSTVRLSLTLMWRMVKGEVSWKNLSGPITIADYAGQSAQMGLAPYLSFLAAISISLAVLNLLPIPVLDGGHLMYYLVEVIKGSPVSERTLEIGQRIGLSLFLFLTVFALFNDFNRLFSG